MEGGYLKFLAALWTGYPEQHSIMPWGLKLFYILQIAYWVHVFPELYFTKVKKVSTDVIHMVQVSCQLNLHLTIRIWQFFHDLNYAGNQFNVSQICRDNCAFK